MIEGSCDVRFRGLKEAFAESFSMGLEVGAACSVVVDGVLVVDVWGGHIRRDGSAWQRDTMVDCRSATKALTALCLHILVDRGLVDLDAPVRRYWPNLRSDPLVRHALAHQAGIPVLDDVPPGGILEWATIAGLVEGQAPMWAPGEQHGYHGVTFGWLVGEPIRRVTGGTVSDVLRREVTGRLGVECFMGTPAHEQGRVAPLVASPRAHDGPMRPSALGRPADSLAARMYAPVLPPLAPPMNSSAFRSAEIPVTGVTGTARAFAAIYGELASGGGRLLSVSTLGEMATEHVSGRDAVLGVPVRRGLGVELTPPGAQDGRPAHAFGHPGGGGVLTFADAEAKLGFAYLNNASWGGVPGQDPRAASLTRAVYDALG